MENDDAIFFGGSFPGLQTGSRLNLLLLQGKLLRIEAGPRPPKDAPAGPNLYWVREIEALVGKEFEETLLREYRPSRSAE